MKMGMELELLVLDDQYRPVNEADRLLSYHLDGLKPECSLSMVEINTVPGDIWAVGSDLLKKLSALESVAAKEGLRVLPIDTHFGMFKPLIRQKERYLPQVKILGKDKFDLCGEIMGQHTHYSLVDDAEARTRQINFLTLSDPVGIALTTSSPKADFANWRVWAYRHVVYDQLHFQGQLQPLKRTYESYLEELDEEFEKFKNFASEKEATIDEAMNRYNAIWGPVRINPTYQTVETRTPGSNPDIGLLLGYSVLLMGGMRRFVDGDIDAEEGLFARLTQEQQLDDQFKQLCCLNSQAMRFGLKDPDVSEYARRFTAFCEKGVLEEERILLGPVKESLKSGRTSADRISDYLSAMPKDLTEEDASTVMRKVHERIYMPAVSTSLEMLRPLGVDAYGC